jgi:hypothetical protein
VQFHRLFIRISLVLALAACLDLPRQSDAAILTAGAASVEIDPLSSSGAFNWNVNGTNHLFQQWFWYRLGDSGPELSIDTLDATPTITPFSGTTGIIIAYDGALLDVTITYKLTSATGHSDLIENIAITNTSGEELHFFQYSDFDLGGTAGNDSGAFTSDSTVLQIDPLGPALSETIISPAADRREIGFFSSVRDKLTDGDADDLANTPILAIVGPGDVTWAFQWDAGASLEIFKDKRLDFVTPPHIPEVPEPTTLAIWGLGLGLLTGVRSFRRRAA